MINALPSDKSPNPGSLPAMPKMDLVSDSPQAIEPITAPISSPASEPSSVHFPDESLNNAGPSTQPHGSVEHLPEKLTAKIYGEAITHPKAADPTGLPPEVVPPAPAPNYPDKSLNSKPKFQIPIKFNPKGLVAALILGLVIAGGGAGYYLFQQNQDIRQQAASEEVTNTETSRTSTEWGIFNQKWQTLIQDSSKNWSDYVAFAQANGARYDCSAPIMTVGKETLYGCDLNAYYALYNTPSYVRPEGISPQDSELNQVLDKMITDSGMLQKAEELGMITLDETIFNSSSKDIYKRFDALKTIRPQLEDQFIKTFDFEFISIYFHNEVDPEIPVAQAQAVAKQKMDVLYQKVQSGELTMAEAGAQIKADAITGDNTNVSLAKMDRLYQQNAYGEIVGKAFDDAVFTDYTLDEEIKSLGEGQMSTVRLCRDQQFTPEQFQTDPNSIIEAPFIDSCYIIFKVNKINFGVNGESSVGGVSQFNDQVNKEYRQETTILKENL